MESNCINICFIGNYSKTLFFEKVSEYLIKNSKVSVYWISVNKHEASRLKKLYDPEKVLLLNKRILNDIGPDISLEEFNDIKINEIIAGDRVLRKEKEWAFDYLRLVGWYTQKFIKKNRIKFVFGELTWGHEIMIFRLLNYFKSDLDCRFLNPHTIRIPNGKFAFFEDEFQSKMFLSNRPSLRTSFHERLVLEKPDYLGINNILLKSKNTFRYRLNKFFNFLTGINYDIQNPTLLESRYKKFLRFMRAEKNRLFFKFYVK